MAIALGTRYSRDVRVGIAAIAAAVIVVSCMQQQTGPQVGACAGSLVPGYPDAGIYFLRDFSPMPDPPRSRLTCFNSVRDAVNAGLKPAPPPPGGVLLDGGIYLVPSDDRLRAACSRAAAVVHFPVPCPGLIPMHRAAVSCPTSDYAPNAGGTDCVENSGAGAPGGVLDTFTYGQSDMVLPDTYTGTAPGANHIWVIGVPADSRLAPFRAACETAVPQTPGPSIFGHPSTWLECPEGGSLHSGHTLLRWVDGAIVYVVSLHGYGPTNREIAQKLADALIFVAAP